MKALHLTFLLVLLSTATATATFTQEQDYTQFVNNLKTIISDKTDTYYHGAYKRLGYISDTFGPRLWGSDALENVIHQVYRMAKIQGFQNVRLEAVKNFTKWVRGEESLYMTDPRPEPTKLKLIGLGGSVPGTVTGQAIVVTDWNDLAAKKDKVKGKIVVYNQKWTTYGQSVDYRANGASNAAKYGAIAALVRSVTPESIQSVHAGIQHYNPAYPAIPVAAITTEDAEMFERIQKRNKTIKLHLTLNSATYPNTFSNNVIFEIKGTKYPEQILLMGGHIDSWDTGSQTGTNDDAGGFLTCFQAMRLILKSGRKPKRTIRFIAWSGQEWGGNQNGAHAYVAAHKNQLKNHIVAFEDDLGSTQLLGFGISSNPNTNLTNKKIVDEIATKYMTLINANKTSDDGEAVDTGLLLDVGIPIMNNIIKDTEDHKYYFTYHHSAGDSLTMMNADELDSNVLGVASMFFILADLENSIPLPNIKMDKVEEIVNRFYQQ